eukprot:561546-Rhodomonas_salina.2
MDRSNPPPATRSSSPPAESPLLIDIDHTVNWEKGVSSTWIPATQFSITARNHTTAWLERSSTVVPNKPRCNPDKIVGPALSTALMEKPITSRPISTTIAPASGGTPVTD